MRVERGQGLVSRGPGRGRARERARERGEKVFWHSFSRQGADENERRSWWRCQSTFTRQKRASPPRFPTAVPPEGDVRTEIWSQCAGKDRRGRHDTPAPRGWSGVINDDDKKTSSPSSTAAAPSPAAACAFFFPPWACSPLFSLCFPFYFFLTPPPPPGRRVVVVGIALLDAAGKGTR